MKISNYILIGFLFIILLFSVTTFINFQLSRAVDQNADYLSRSGMIIRNSGRFQRNMLNMVNGLRGYLLTSEKYFIDSYDSAANDNGKILQQLMVAITDSRQIKLLSEIMSLNDKWIAEYTEPLRQAKSLATVNDSSLLAFNRLYKERFSSGIEKELQGLLHQKFRNFTNFEYEIREKRSVELVSAVDRTRQISLILTILSMVTALLVAGFLIKRISYRISKMVKIANSIASGNYGVTLKDTGSDELSALAFSLNHMSAELLKNIALLKSKNEELDQFAHIVSHDLKGPLRGIDNVVGWIEEDHKNELTKKVGEYVEIIKGRVVRAQNLIDGILSYARTDKDKREKEEVNVNELVKEIFQSLPSNSPIKAEVAELPSILTERIPLLQVFSNLINNAIRYNDKSEAVIKVHHKEHPSFYEFYVEDNGPGIAETYHKKIFVVFQTLKERDSFESTGVGLAIVKKILDARREEIRLLSSVGAGSIFSFTWSKS